MLLTTQSPYAVSANIPSSSASTHMHVQSGTSYTGDVTIYYEGKRINIGETLTDLIELNNNFNILMKYLQYKNIIINDQDFEEFKESQKLGDYLSKEI